MSLEWKVVPIQQWPGERTEERRSHPFRKTVSSRWGGGTRTVPEVDWSSTTELLERELRMIEAENIVLQMAVTDRMVRLDGWIRADARPAHPGVILTFDSIHGPLSYPCDTFDDWQANVRAIALALEALRKVNRYGVSRRGEQYRGWKQLPAAGQSTTTLTARTAAAILATMGGAPATDPDTILEDPELATRLHRRALRTVHPDAGGSAKDFHRLQEAKGVLDAHHGEAAHA